ncbi:C-type lectin domain family 4 member C-like [Oratosquilla oratoria]|uniref:C-type lectin domain family 4 member C-like n=1 Tax=Oratosquilla oratoria TaxID=337810 RepID=UPI003F76BCD0
MDFPALLLLTSIMTSWAYGEQQCQDAVAAALQQVLVKSSLDHIVSSLVDIEKRLAILSEEVRHANKDGIHRGNSGVVIDEANRTCPSPFTFVYGRCVLADTGIKGYWVEMRHHCQAMGADLVTVDSPNFHWHLVQHLHATGANKESYWLGGKKDDGGVWRWVDNSPVMFGTPSWGYWNDFKGREPASSETYICMYQPGLYYLHGCPDPWNKVHPICQLPIESQG